jgi:hypothetical protein
MLGLEGLGARCINGVSRVVLVVVVVVVVAVAAASKDRGAWNSSKGLVASGCVG